MPWLKLDDQTYRHRKVLKVGNEAFGAWVRMCCFSASELDEGFIGEEALPLVGATPKLVEKLVDVGLLEAFGDGWQIHDFLDYNPTRDQVLAQRDQRRDAGRRGGIAKAKGNGRG